MSRLQIRRRRVGVRGVALLTLTAVLTSCGWQGIANVPLPGGADTGKPMTIYVTMPDTLALNVNSRVRVKDVFVGTVRAIELKDWTATLTLDVASDVDLPENSLAAIGQTTLLGSQHVQLDPPADHPSPQRLKNGDTIPEDRSSSFPTTERVLASIGAILSGGGIPNLEVIQTELNNVLDGRAGRIRELIDQLDVFTAALNDQRNDIIRTIDSSNRLLGIVAARNDSLDRVLTEFPPLIKHFADTRDLVADALEALGRVSAAADQALAPSGANLRTDLQNLQRPLKQLVRASPYLIGALGLILTLPFPSGSAAKAFRGDYINVSLNVDLTLSSLDHSLFSGTGISGALRALEQSWGRDPSTMIPDVRFTPNPHDAPNGPLVERGE